jgi:hypothetical protein
MSTNSGSAGHAVRIVIWLAVTVAAAGGVLWYLEVIERLAPIVAGAAAVIVVTAGAALRSRSGRGE